MTKQLLFATLFLFSISQLYAQDDPLVGYSVAVVEADRVLKLEGSGYADLETERPYTAQTVQNVGSVSKTFIALAIMKAVEQGKLQLDEDINTYLDFQVVSPHYGKENVITVRHLATHTSGIIDWAAYRRSYTQDLEPEMTMGEYLKSYLVPGGRMYTRMNYHKSEAGTRYKYSNIAATLAAYVVEQTTGQDFAAYTQQYILDPLGMVHSGWSYGAIDLDQHATLYKRNRRPVKTYTLCTYPDGGFRTSAEDLARYLQEVLRGHQGNSTILSASSWGEIFRASFGDGWEVENMNYPERNIGLFFSHTAAGAIGHTGSDPGAAAIMRFDPETGRGYLMITNQDITRHNSGTVRAQLIALREVE
ncbi:MAG TPA: serine hydrolase [Cytophagales bacterium]|nr:serine hydrolase [Cytophagales bacterium]